LQANNPSNNFKKPRLSLDHNPVSRSAIRGQQTYQNWRALQRQYHRTSGYFQSQANMVDSQLAIEKSKDNNSFIQIAKIHLD
jgi:hypothetical protein